MTKRIIFLLFPHTHLMDLAGPAQVFYEARQLGGRDYQMIYTSMTSKVTSEQDLMFSGLSPIQEVEPNPADFICVPGVDFRRFQAGELDFWIEQVAPWMQKQHRKGVFVGSICSGALILAKMRLLNHHRCTTHWKCLDYLQDTFPRTVVEHDRLYTFDRNIFTSSGMTAGIDMALALVERWDSPLIAARVAQEMVINIRRPENVTQRNIFLDFKNHFNADVYRAQQILSTELRSTFTVGDLARQLHLSPRHLARLFRDHTGETIQAYRDRVRIKLGERLLQHSEKSIKEISIECGFENTRQFLRIWKKYRGCTPTAYRSKDAGAIKK